MLTVFFIAFSPRTVGTGTVGFQEEYLHRKMTYRNCIIWYLYDLW